MRNFFRAVKIGLQYRFTCIGIVLCSLLVAVFWSANIGTIYPLVEVVFQGKSATQYLDGGIEELQLEITQKQTLIQTASSIDDTSFLRNPNYHELSDTIDTLNFDKMTEVVKGVYNAVKKF